MRSWGGPGGKKLRERDDAKGGVTAAAVHVLGVEVERAEVGEAVGAELGEFVQELW